MDRTPLDPAITDPEAADLPPHEPFTDPEGADLPPREPFVDPDPADPDRTEAPDPAPVDPDPAVSGLVDPALLLSAAAVADPALVDPALVDPVLVDPALVDPCSDPGAVPVTMSDTAAAPESDSTVDPPVPAREEPATTGTAPAPVPAPESASTVGVESRSDTPAAPPAPVRLPAPPPSLPSPAPAGPAGCPTSTSSGACCYGPGQTEHADGVDAVLDARVTASLAQAAVRPTSGFAGDVVGGDDDPGVRPG